MVKTKLTRLETNSEGKLETFMGASVKVVKFFEPVILGQHTAFNNIESQAPRGANAYLIGNSINPPGRDVSGREMNNSYTPVQFYKVTFKK